jgi:hypothetical protein
MSQKKLKGGQHGAEPRTFVNLPTPETVISAAVTEPVLTSILRVPKNVPLERTEYVPETSNVFAFANPKLIAIAHNAPAIALLHRFMDHHPR